MKKSLPVVVLACLAAMPARAETVVVEADGYVDVVAGRIVWPARIVVEGQR
jgi:hypothetical protein